LWLVSTKFAAEQKNAILMHAKTHEMKFSDTIWNMQSSDEISHTLYSPTDDTQDTGSISVTESRDRRVAEYNHRVKYPN